VSGGIERLGKAGYRLPMPNNLFRTTLTAGAIVLLATGSGRLDGTVEAQAPSPVIRIDFQAVTADGRPVTDLGPGDVTVRIAGRPRDVRSLDLVEVAGGAPRPAGPARPPFVTNVPPAGWRTHAVDRRR
jgi:hypothetical protein